MKRRKAVRSTQCRMAIGHGGVQRGSGRMSGCREACTSSVGLPEGPRIRRKDGRWFHLTLAAHRSVPPDRPRSVGRRSPSSVPCAVYALDGKMPRPER